MSELIHYQRKYRELTLRELTAVYVAHGLSDVAGSLKADYQRSIKTKFEDDIADLAGSTIFHFELDKNAGDLECHITAQLKYTYTMDTPKVDKSGGTDELISPQVENTQNIGQSTKADSEDTPSYSMPEGGKTQESQSDKDMQQFASIISTSLATAMKHSNADQKRHSINYRFKLEYSEDKGIEPFISQIESWAKATKVDNDEDIIRTAIAVLDHSEYGFAVKQAFGHDELTNWQKCKDKLIELMGHDQAYYRARFRSYKRKSGESAGMCLSKLILCYKNGFKDPKDDLTLTDETQIKNQFISTLSQPIKGFVEMQESSLTLANIASATKNIERSFGFNNASESSKLSFLENDEVININHLDAQPKSLPEIQLVDVIKSMNDQTQKMFETLTRQSQAAAEKQTNLITSLLSKLNTNERPMRFNNNNNFRGNKDYSKYKGYCVGHVQFGKCRRLAEGRECNFKHGEIPA